MPHQYDSEKAKKMVDRVDEIRRKGKRLPEACKEAGVSKHVYGYWSVALRKRASGVAPFAKARGNRQFVSLYAMCDDGSLVKLCDLDKV